MRTLPFPEDPFPPLPALYLRAMQRAARRVNNAQAQTYAAHARFLLREAARGKRAGVVTPVDLALSSAEEVALAAIEEERRAVALIAGLGQQSRAVSARGCPAERPTG